MLPSTAQGLNKLIGIIRYSMPFGLCILYPNSLTLFASDYASGERTA